MVTDAGGNVVARHDYLPFGVEIPSGSAGRTSTWGTSDSLSTKFTAQERDSNDTGLDFFQARYHASGQARFLSPDSLGNFVANSADPQTWNQYAYVRNNPLVFVDPSGHDCVYLNDAGTGIENGGIDNQSTSEECSQNGGYWVEGTVTQAYINADNAFVGLVGTTTGTDTTLATYQDRSQVSNDRPPDFYTLNLNVGWLGGWSGTLSLDRYGSWFYSWKGVTAGKSATIVSASLTANGLIQSAPPSEAQMENFLSGHGVNVGAGFWGGATASWSPGNGFATGGGFFTPQVGISYNYSSKGPGRIGNGSPLW
jgi:RHS repeat-associated protein